MTETPNERPAFIYVWDPFVRFFHWSIVLLFAISYLTGDEVMSVHPWSGYLIGILLVLRIVWGFVGPRRARFSDFLYKPAAIFGYLTALLRRKSTRHLGHSPAGGAMVIALLAGLTVSVASGLVQYAMEDGAGPLSSVIVQVPEDEDNAVLGTVNEIHEIAANLTLALVIVHFCAVLFAGYVHRENLIRAMFSGYKRAD